jgi:DNA-binding transcriptional LysR family regulator
VPALRYCLFLFKEAFADDLVEKDILMRPPQINLNHIISFYFVAHEGSFEHASERLCITGPAINQQIRALERQFGVRLVYVKKNRACLTKAGEKFLAYAEQFFAQATGAEDFLKSYRLTNLRLGIAGTLMAYAANIVNRFQEAYPTVQVTIRQVPSSLLMQELVQFEHDICLVGSLCTSDERAKILCIPEVERMVLVASPDHTLAARSVITWEDLTKYPLIIQSEGSATRDFVLQHFRIRGLRPLIGAQVDNIECQKVLAQQKKCIAFVFLPNIRDELATGSLRILPLADGELKFGVDILRNWEVGLSPVAEAFVQVARKFFNYDLL